MLDEDFWVHLEYRISEAFANSTDNSIVHLWCDGVLPPTSDSELSKKKVNDTREIITSAFIGLDGQSRFELILKFGNKALSRYARGLSIIECVPDSATNDWYNIDLTKKELIVYLL